MRTTIDLPDELFRKAKSLAAQRGVSLKSLLTEALRKETATPDSSKKRTRHVSFPLIRSKRKGDPAKLANELIEEVLTIDDLK